MFEMTIFEMTIFETFYKHKNLDWKFFNTVILYWKQIISVKRTQLSLFTGILHQQKYTTNLKLLIY